MDKSVALTSTQLLFIAAHFEKHIREMENSAARASFSAEIKQYRAIVDAIYDAMPEWKDVVSRYSSQRP